MLPHFNTATSFNRHLPPLYTITTPHHYTLLNLIPHYAQPTRTTSTITTTSFLTTSSHHHPLHHPSLIPCYTTITLYYHLLPLPPLASTLYIYYTNITATTLFLCHLIRPPPYTNTLNTALSVINTAPPKTYTTTSPTTLHHHSHIPPSSNTISYHHLLPLTPCTAISFHLTPTTPLLQHCISPTYTTASIIISFHQHQFQTPPYTTTSWYHNQR